MPNQNAGDGAVYNVLMAEQGHIVALFLVIGQSCYAALGAVASRLKPLNTLPRNPAVLRHRRGSITLKLRDPATGICQADVR